MGLRHGSSGRRRSISLAITALCSVQLVDVLGVTVVVTALPTMLADLHAPASAGSLVSGGYAMFFGGLLMLGGAWATGSATGALHRQPGRARRRALLGASPARSCC